MCERSYATLEVGDAVLVENYKWSQKLVSAADPGLGYTWEASLRAICSDLTLTLTLTLTLAPMRLTLTLTWLTLTRTRTRTPNPTPNQASLNTSHPAGRLLKLTAAEEQALMQAPPPDAAPADGGAAGPSDAPAPAPARPRLLPLPAPRLHTRAQLLGLLEDGGLP